MGQGYRRIYEEQLRHWFSNDIGTTNHDCSLPSRSIPYFLWTSPWSQQALKAPWEDFRFSISVPYSMDENHPHLLSDQSLKDRIRHRYASSGGCTKNPCQRILIVVFDHLIIQLIDARKSSHFHYEKPAAIAERSFYFLHRFLLDYSYHDDNEARYNSCLSF